MDVGVWLRGLGLERYEEKFRDNNIDLDVLPQLTVDDLKDIGISAVGDRRRLLAAICCFGRRNASGGCSPSPDSGQHELRLRPYFGCLRFTPRAAGIARGYFPVPSP